MKSYHIDTLLPPWKTTASWEEANRTIGTMAARHSGRLKTAGSLASSVRVALEHSFSLIDETCLKTCPYCPDPCCLTSSPWYDYRDLIFLHLNDIAIPPGQPISDWKATCRYVCLRGCTLDRIMRPWICTWYLCSVQTALLRNRRTDQWIDLSRTISEIRTLRKEMEDEFIRAT